MLGINLIRLAGLASCARDDAEVALAVARHILHIVRVDLPEIEVVYVAILLIPEVKADISGAARSRLPHRTGIAA